jgi:hypothetical protein
VRFDCQKWLKSEEFATAHYQDTGPKTKFLAMAKTLFKANAAQLPKASLGRGCIRFKRVSDVDLDVIDGVIRAAAAYDGQRFEPAG